MTEPAVPMPAGEPQLPDYLHEFIGQFLADPQRVNLDMAFEFIRDFYVWAGREFAEAREYAESQLQQIDVWRNAMQDPEGP